MHQPNVVALMVKYVFKKPSEYGKYGGILDFYFILSDVLVRANYLYDTYIISHRVYCASVDLTWSSSLLAVEQN